MQGDTSTNSITSVVIFKEQVQRQPVGLASILDSRPYAVSIVLTWKAVLSSVLRPFLSWKVLVSHVNIYITTYIEVEPVEVWLDAKVAIKRGPNNKDKGHLPALETFSHYQL